MFGLAVVPKFQNLSQVLKSPTPFKQTPPVLFTAFYCTLNSRLFPMKGRARIQISDESC